MADLEPRRSKTAKPPCLEPGTQTGGNQVSRVSRASRLLEVSGCLAQPEPPGLQETPSTLTFSHQQDAPDEFRLQEEAEDTGTTTDLDIDSSQAEVSPALPLPLPKGSKGARPESCAGLRHSIHPESKALVPLPYPKPQGSQRKVPKQVQPYPSWAGTQVPMECSYCLLQTPAAIPRVSSLPYGILSLPSPSFS
ncbi:hypothetical protein HispidOSU_007111 [Sigmodon hispidus]